MRFGLVLAGEGGTCLTDLSEQAAHAEQNGFDLVWIGPDTFPDAGPAGSVLVAAALAPTVPTLRIGVSVGIGDVNPIYPAEDLAVADLVANGRILAAAYPVSGYEERFAEALDVLQFAHASRPFRHEGHVWRIPANLKENLYNIEYKVRVTPSPAQLELPIWLEGAAAFDNAAGRCLSVLGSADQATEEIAAGWSSMAERLGPLALQRLRRSRRLRLDVTADGKIDPDRIVKVLESERAAWGMDVVLWELPVGLDRPQRQQAVENLGHRVWPRVQLDRLPQGLVVEWARRESDADASIRPDRV